MKPAAVLLCLVALAGCKREWRDISLAWRFLSNVRNHLHLQSRRRADIWHHIASVDRFQPKLGSMAV